ncbi:hypothetical protein PR202_ga12310 [Eleusine coracana subsp. coracana]|uniref:Uncharacterized protein n=1 Tax=Eleusine coracana subsp. coracana TaxID=191504 RepID=A0AAV5CBF5_ELECO|nr:hypothetical protein PR202_ga12310 [Eleusine coracana subsp. coracana]
MVPWSWWSVFVDAEKGSLLKAALDGNLGRLKGMLARIIKNLGMGPAAIFSVIIDGFGVLHCAAAHGHLEVCKYLVEELGGDPNMAAGVAEFEGVTPFIFSVHSEDVSIVKYFLDHGGDPMKADAKGCSVLHYAVCTGQGGYTDLIPSLLKAGADPNSPDDLGWLPIERAALRKCREEVKMLLPLTSPIPKVPNWTVDGVISYAEFKSRKPLAKEPYNKRIAIFKSQAANAFKQKKYAQASKNYSLDKPSATLYSNRSLCKLRMGDGKGALSDAKQCRMMRPGWAKACYRQGAAHMLLKEYKQACDAFLDAEKLDPGNEEIERELR